MGNLAKTNDEDTGVPEYASRAISLLWEPQTRKVLPEALIEMRLADYQEVCKHVDHEAILENICVSRQALALAFAGMVPRDLRRQPFTYQSFFNKEKESILAAWPESDKSTYVAVEISSRSLLYQLTQIPQNRLREG